MNNRCNEIRQYASIRIHRGAVCGNSRDWDVGLGRRKPARCACEAGTHRLTVTPLY